MPITIDFFVFILGAAVGSFLNVCILRLPKEMSVVFPSSHCFSCNKPIAWFDNIPLISFLVIKGKCRHCGQKISWQYFFIELVTAITFVVIYRFFGLTPKAVVYAALSSALIVQTLIDLRYQIIPDEITLPGIVLGLVCSGFFPQIHDSNAWIAGLVKSLAGMLVGGGFLYLTAVLGEWIFKKEAMGGGDVKLLAMIGTVIGWQGVIWTIFMASVFGSVVGIYLRMKRGDQLIPFGPYIGLGAFLYLFFGQPMIALYVKTLGF